MGSCFNTTYIPTFCVVFFCSIAALLSNLLDFCEDDKDITKKEPCHEIILDVLP